MAKRFTDTDKWKRAWFCKLDPKAKLVWFYLLDQCDHRGVWFENFELLSLQVGFSVKRAQFDLWFGEKIKFFDGDKYFLKSFVDFQYGDLKPTNNAHKAIIYLISSLENLAPHEDLNSSSGGAQDKDKDKDKDNVLGECEGGEAEVINPRVLVEIWNSSCGPLPKVEYFSNARKAKAKIQLTKNPILGHYRAVIAKWISSEFCTNTWRPGFDDLMSEEKRISTLEGKYDNRAPIAKGPRPIIHKRAEEVLAEQASNEPLADPSKIRELMKTTFKKTGAGENQ